MSYAHHKQHKLWNAINKNQITAERLFLSAINNSNSNCHRHNKKKKYFLRGENGNFLLNRCLLICNWGFSSIIFEKRMKNKNEFTT